MKLSGAQVKVIAILNVLLLVLAGAIAAEIILSRGGVEPPVENAGAEIDPVEPPAEEIEAEPYSLIRNSRLGSGGAEREINLGGSGRDEGVALFSDGKSLTVFGNTDSADFDAEGADGRAIMMTLDLDLNVTGRAFVGPAGAGLLAVIPAEGGFLCAFSEENRVILALVTPAGDTLFTAETGEGETFAALRLFGSGYALVTSLKYALSGKIGLVFRVYSPALERRYERVISTPYSLAFVNCFELKDCAVVFFAAGSDLGSHAGVATLSESPNVAVTRLTGGGNCRPLAVIPVPAGYAVAATFEDGGAGIMTVGADLSVKKITYSGEAGFDSCTFLYGGGEYFCSFTGGGRRATIAYDASFSSYRLVPELDRFGAVYGCYGEVPLFACSDGNSLYVADGRGKEIAFGSGECRDLRLLETGSDVYALATADEAGGGVGANFGGPDIWLAKLAPFSD